MAWAAQQQSKPWEEAFRWWKCVRSVCHPLADAIKARKKSPTQIDSFYRLMRWRSSGFLGNQDAVIAKSCCARIFTWAIQGSTWQENEDYQQMTTQGGLIVGFWWQFRFDLIESVQRYVQIIEIGFSKDKNLIKAAEKHDNDVSRTRFDFAFV